MTMIGENCVRRTASFLFVLLTVHFVAVGICQSQQYEGLAHVSTLRLHDGESVSIEPLSRIGVILLAVGDCTILVNGSPADLKAGERRFVHGREIVKVSPSGSRPTTLVIVNLKRARQAQTFDRVELTPGEVMEDASSSNETLLVALNALRLRDIINNSDEREPSNHGQPHTLSWRRARLLGCDQECTRSPIPADPRLASLPSNGKSVLWCVQVQAG